MTTSAASDHDASGRAAWQATLQAWLGPLLGIMRALIRPGPGERLLMLAPIPLAGGGCAVREHGLTTPVLNQGHQMLGGGILRPQTT